MPTPAAPTFSAGLHTKARSPQRNGVNIPSGQVADASSDPSLSAPFEQAEEDVDVDENDDIFFLIHAPPHKPHVPDSNGESSSTERGPNTDDTLTDPFHNDSNTSAAPSPPVTPAYPAPVYSQLTQTNMALHQREMAQLYPPTTAGWVTEAGMGTRLIRSPPASVAYSMLTTVASVGTGVSVASSAGVAGLDRLESLQSSMQAGIQVFGVGAWCETADGLE